MIRATREFVQVPRLWEVFRADEVAAASRDAIARGAIGFDAVKHLVLCRIERRPPRLNMTVYPYLPLMWRRVGQDVPGPADGGGDDRRYAPASARSSPEGAQAADVLREYNDKLARQCAAEGLDHIRFLLRLAELELIDRERAWWSVGSRRRSSRL